MFWCFNDFLNPFVPNTSFCYPLKTSENHIFRGYRKCALGANGLISNTLPSQNFFYFTVKLYLMITQRLTSRCIKKSLHKKCPCSKLFWSEFSRIRTEYREVWIISPSSVQILENVDLNNFQLGHFSRSKLFTLSLNKKLLNI